MTPADKKAKTSAKSAKKAARPAARAKPGTTKRAAKKASKKTAKPTTSKAPAAKTEAAAEACAALTTKGTRCRLKPSGDTPFCARHQDAAEVAPAVTKETQVGKNGQAARPAAKAEKRSVPEVEAETLAAEAKARPAKARKAKTVRRPKDQAGQQTELPKAGGTVAPADEVDEVPSEDDDYVLYGSVYSTTLEASPYEDQMTKEMAEGSDDVELVDENQMGRRGGGRGGPRGGRDTRSGGPREGGRGGPRGGSGGRGGGQGRPEQQAPQMNREDAEAKAREKLGPRPEIAPEEDLDGTLQAYDQKFRSEVNHLMGRKRRKRGRRGGRRRRGGGNEGGGQGGSGGDGGGRGGGGGRGRGRRGGRNRRGGGQSDGGSGSSSGGGRSRGGGAPKNVARDSPLANNRPSRGPKRAVQPRKRREPDV